MSWSASPIGPGLWGNALRKRTGAIGETKGRSPSLPTNRMLVSEGEKDRAIRLNNHMPGNKKV